MRELQISGRYTSAIVYLTDNPDTAIDQYAIAKIQQICDLEWNEGNTIRIMPDVHPAKSCVVGFTMKLNSDYTMPSLVGSDIGCGISVTELSTNRIDFKKLDSVIREYIPTGFKISSKRYEYQDLSTLCCKQHIDLDRACFYLSTLGNGNHFIEIAKDCSNKYYLLIHTGSRRLGKEICDWYLYIGKRDNIPYELSYLNKEHSEEYIHDMQVAQGFASENRRLISQIICKQMKWKTKDYWESIHNYIDDSYMGESRILRKGAISAYLNEKCIIPCNMKEGSLIGIGKGDPNWNYSAPHGSGRINSRADIKKNHTLTEYKREMKGIYTSCISPVTLDEAPFAYRSQDDIMKAVYDTVDIQNIIVPVYNFKAGN